MRAIIYARVSTEEQKLFGYSLGAQIEVCKDYCKKRGWDIVKIYKEAVTTKFEDKLSITTWSYSNNACDSRTDLGCCIFQSQHGPILTTIGGSGGKVTISKFQSQHGPILTSVDENLMARLKTLFQSQHGPILTVSHIGPYFP